MTGSSCLCGSVLSLALSGVVCFTPAAAALESDQISPQQEPVVMHVIRASGWLGAVNDNEKGKG